MEASKRQLEVTNEATAAFFLVWWCFFQGGRLENRWLTSFVANDKTNPDSRHSPASNSPGKCGGQAERDRQDRYGTQPHIYDRQTTVAVGDAAPDVRSEKAPEHEGRR